MAMAFNTTFLLEIGREVSIIYLGILIGYLFGYSRFYSKKIAKNLSHLATYILFPLIIILNTLSIREGQLSEIMNVLIFSVALHLFLLGVSILLLKNNNLLEKGSSILTASFPNTVTYAFPIIAAIIGLAGWVPATIFAMGSLITMVTVGGAVALRYGKSHENQPNYRESLVKLLKFPFFIALIVSIVLRGTVGYIDNNQYSSIIVWKYLGIGVGLVLIGIDCRALTRIALLKSSMNRTGIVRFIISPIFAIVVCLIFRFPRLIAIPLIVQAWGPPAIMTILYSEFFGLDTQTTSRNVAVLTFMALLLLPLQIVIIFWLYPA